MGNVGIYLRVSTDKQTLEQQEQEIRMLSTLYRVDLKNAVRYLEHGASANKPKYYRIQDRPEGGRLWADMEAGRLDTVVILEPDRMWRDGVSGVTEATYLTQTVGVKLLCMLGGATPIDLTTSEGFASFWNTMGAAQKECMKTSERVTRKQKYNLKIGKAITGTCFGWNTDEEGYLSPNYEQQAVIAWAIKEFQNLRNSKPSWRGIATVLNRKGVVGAMGRTGTWTSSSLKRTNKSVTQQALGPEMPARIVTHPILGKVRVGGDCSVPADRFKEWVEEQKQVVCVF